MRDETALTRSRRHSHTGPEDRNHAAPMSPAGQRPRSPLLHTLTWLNVALRAIMEAGVVAGLAYWGLTTGDSTIARILFGVGAPVVGFGLWGAVDFHRAGRYAEALRLLQELTITALAALALVEADQPELGSALAALSIIHHGLVYAVGARLLEQRR